MAPLKSAKDLSKSMRVFLILFISIGGWSVYSLYSLRKVFYSDFINFLNITNTQFGDLVSIWGIACMICYIPGGILGDKIRMKYLAPLGLFCTAGAIFWFISAPSYSALCLMYIAYGISTGLIFWSCRYKIIRMISANEKEYNKNIGWSYCVWAITGVVLSSLLVYILTKIPGNIGLISVLTACAVINIILALCGIIFIPKFALELETKQQKIWHLDNFKTAIKNPGIILSSLAMFFIYSIYTSQYITTVFLENAFLASGVLVGITGTIRNYGVNTISDPIMGYLGKRFKASNVLIAANLIMIILMTIMTLLPREAAFATIVAILIIIYAFCMNGSYCISSALLTECQIPENIFGTVVGIYSFVGFSPDVIIHPIVGRIMDQCGAKAYTYINLLMLGCSICAVISIVLLIIYLKKAAKIKN